MQYRFARPEEVPQLARLIAHSFIGRTHDFWLEQLQNPPHGGGPASLFAAFADDRPVAALQIHPLKQWIGGAALPMAGIATVTVSPAHRQKGLGATLMQQALHAAAERGDVASALYPFRVSFYRKLGYGTAGEVLQYQASPDAFPAAEQRLRCELLDTPAAIDAALVLYHHWIRTQTGQIERTSQSWQNEVSAPDTGLIGYRNSQGQLEGYALVHYRADLPPEKRFLDVNELVWTTPAARTGLYGWLASLGDQWQRIMVRALRSHHLTEILHDVRLPRKTTTVWGLWAGAGVQMTGPMFRLVHLPRAWEQRATAAAEPLAVSLYVRDEQLPQNNGAWTLEIADNKAQLKPEAKGQWSITLDVSTLSRLYISALQPSVAFEAGLLQCDRPERLPLLDAALRLPEPWMFDRF